MQFMEFLKIIAPLAIELVQVIERLYPQGTSGPTKLNHALQVVQALAQSFPELFKDVTSFRDAVTPIINGAVAAMNETK